MKKEKQTAFRFSEKTIKSIEFLSKRNDFNATEVVETAINEMVKREQYKIQQNIKEFQLMVSELIDPLQGIRDYDEEMFTPEMEEFLHLLMQNFDAIPTLKGLKEKNDSA